MAAEVYIHLDQNRTVYAPGDTIRGTVTWKTRKPPRDVTVALRWRTEGRGSTDSEDVVTVSLRPLFDEIPQDGSAPFEISIPSAVAPSYRGRLVAVCWEIRAVCDLSFAIDPHEETEVVISRTGAPLRPPGDTDA